MKVACFAVFTILAAVLSSAYGTAGRSACKDESEIGQTYPHHFDHTKYWYCEKFGEPAVEKQCQKDFAYMHYLRECIPWANWIWKKPVNPPTLA